MRPQHKGERQQQYDKRLFHIANLIIKSDFPNALFKFFRRADRIDAEPSWIWSAIFIVSSAFFIYGPQALLGVSCSQYATKRAAGSANGVCGVFCYAATVISGIGFGWLADNPALGWNAVFIVAIAFGLMGSVILFSYWKAPANGYEKAEVVLREMNLLN